MRSLVTVALLVLSLSARLAHAQQAAAAVEVPPPSEGERSDAARAPKPAPPSALRPVSYVLLGLSFASAGVGAYFGIAGNGVREGIKADLLRGVDASELSMREQMAATDATVAATLLISAGVLAVTGGIFWFLGRDTGANVAVAPVVTPNGGALSVTGRF